MKIAAVRVDTYISPTSRNKPLAQPIYTAPTLGPTTSIIALPNPGYSSTTNKNPLNKETQHRGDTSKSSVVDLAIQEKSGLQEGFPPPSVEPVNISSPLPSTTIIGLLTACLTLSNIVMAFINTSVTVMLDELAEDLDIAENNLQWTVNSFQLPLGCMILVAGKAADIGGRKRIFMIGMFFLCVIFLISGFMKTEISFYVCRAVAGIANALIAGSNIGILVENTGPDKLRSIVIGVCISGLPFGGAFGFTVAGPLAEKSGWRSVFYLVAGSSLLPLIGVFFLALDRKETGEHVDKRIDWAEGLLFTVGSVLLFFCLSQSISESDGWSTPYIIALLVTSLVLLSAAILWVYYLEQKTNYPPIMRLSIVTRNNGRVGVVYYVAFCCIACYAGLIFTANIQYQRYEDLQPTELMLRYLPGPIVGTICNVGVGLLASRVPGIWFFIVGSLSIAVANVLYAAMDESASYWHFQFPAQAICVIGPDLVVAIGYIYISTVVESWEVAVAGASLQYFLSLAFVAGPSLSTLIYKSLVFKKHGSALTQEESRKNADLLESLRASFWFWAALCFSSTIVTLLFLRDMGKTSGKPQTTVNKGELPPPTDDKASLTLNAPGAALESGRREEESRDD